MVIKGHISDYPLPLLWEIFLHRRETGLLELSSQSDAGYFFLKDGQLIDAEVGELRGAEAVRFAETLIDASFQFKALPPAEYARLVWEKSLEGLRKGLTDGSHSRALAVYSGIRQFLVYLATASRSLEETLRSTADVLLAWATLAYKRQKQATNLKSTANALLARASIAYKRRKQATNLKSTADALLARASLVYKRKKQATQTGLAALQTRLAAWQSQGAQRIQVLNVRIFNLVPDLKRERILALVRNRAQLLSLLNQEPLRRNFSAVVAVAFLGGILMISTRQVELRRNQTHTSSTGNESAKLAESQAQSTAVLSKRPGFANKPGVTDLLLGQTGEASGKESLQRSTSKVPNENNRDTSRTKRSKFLIQAKALAPAQPHTNLPAVSAAPKAKETSTQAAETISVVLQIEDGRVSKASLFARRPGREGYEAAALRIARQRRYPAGAKGTDTVIVKINNSNPD